MTTEEKFHAAVNVIRNLPKNGAYQPSHDLKLRFYAYFKQATEGPCNISKPAFWDIVGKTKYDAWRKLGNMSKKEAMENYVEELKKIVETMSYNENVGMFLGSLGNFYDNVPVEDIEMLLGPVIERVRARPGSPLQNSPLGSRETSPTRIPRHLVNKTNISSLETTPLSSMSPSPQPPDTDDENEEFIDTVETTPHACRKIFKSESSSVKDAAAFDFSHQSSEKADGNQTVAKVNGHVAVPGRSHVANARGLREGEDEDSEPRGQGPSRGKTPRDRESPGVVRRRTAKQNGGVRGATGTSSADLAEPLREAVLRLQKDLDRITARVRTLEVALLSQPQAGSPSPGASSKVFSEISRTTLAFIVVWPLFLHILVRFLSARTSRNCTSNPSLGTSVLITHGEDTPPSGMTATHVAVFPVKCRNKSSCSRLR